MPVPGAGSTMPGSGFMPYPPNSQYNTGNNIYPPYPAAASSNIPYPGYGMYQSGGLNYPGQGHSGSYPYPPATQPVSYIYEF